MIKLLFPIVLLATATNAYAASSITLEHCTKVETHVVQESQSNGTIYTQEVTCTGDDFEPEVKKLISGLTGDIYSYSGVCYNSPQGLTPCH